MKLDRLMGILTTILLQNEKVTARGGDGGISIMEGYRLGNRDAFTAQEQLINLYGYHEDSLSEKTVLLKSAITQRRAIRFNYYYPKGEMSREIEPYFVQYTWGDWYVFGWRRLREDFRRFKLGRLWNLTLTDDTFEPRPVPPEQASGSDAFPAKYSVKILFDKSVRYRLIEDYGLHCYEETDEGLLFSLEYGSKEYAFSWVLGFGNKAKILAPEETREEFAALVQNISERYE